MGSTSTPQRTPNSSATAHASQRPIAARCLNMATAARTMRNAKMNITSRLAAVQARTPELHNRRN
eukprot:1954770-Pyramimonas_sp.AAC.1